MYFTKLRSWIAAIISLFTLISYVCPTAQACTLYAANGFRVSGGGTLITKIRDQIPTNQYYYTFKPESGYKYFGLFTSPNGKGLRCAINEKGLVLVTATAGTIPKQQRLNAPTLPGGLSKYILTRYSSIEQLINDPPAIWGSPQFIMLADKKEIAYIEVGLNNSYSLTRSESNTLCHTNHFLSADMQSANLKAPSASSTIRLARIDKLLCQKQHLTITDFIDFAQDKNSGYNNSLWRIGNPEKPSSVQSLAAFIVHLNTDGTGELYLKIRESVSDKGHETIIRKKLHDLF